MKTMIFLSGMIFLVCMTIFSAEAQWSANGNDIYNTNTGYVGIGNNTPGTLLYVAKNMTEPTVTIRNAGGFGGATYSMLDDASGASWKFKAITNGGFKIRDQLNGLDIITIEPNSFANALYAANYGSVGINTANPDNSSLLDLSSTTKGFLVPQMTQTQIAAISNPSNGLLAYCTTDYKLYAYVAGAGCWKELMFVAPGFMCGNTITVNHVAGNVAAVTKTVIYGTVNNIPGEVSKCWITRNLGASQQAGSQGDPTEASAGWYWQFNLPQGYMHDGTTRTPGSAWNSGISENSDWIAANDPCALELGSGWRLPTYTEWNNVRSAGSWIDWNGPWTSALKLHAAGILQYSDGSLTSRGSDGNYYSGTQSDNIGSWSIYFNLYSFYMAYSVKSFGNSVRCVY